MADDGDKMAMFVAVTGSSDADAIQMLESTGWNVEEAVQLFFASGADADVGAGLPPPSLPPNAPGPVPAAIGGSNWATGSRHETGAGQPPAGNAAAPPIAPLLGAADDDVRAPLPVRREALYGPASYGSGAVPGNSMTPTPLAGGQYGLPQQLGLVPPNPFAVSQGQAPQVDAFRDFAQEAADRDAARAAAAGSAGDAEGAEPVTAASRQAGRGSQANLASLYKPPADLLYKGGFEEAKSHAMRERRWLLVNLQSNTEFASHLLNRDTWANEMVKNMVSTYFVLWQVYENTVEGRKICTYYNLHSAPVTMVINPRTGQRQKSWEGAVGAEQLLEDLMPFIDEQPSGSRTGAPPPQKKPRDKDVSELPVTRGFDDLENLEEDEQLRMALAASLEAPPSVAAQVPKVEHTEPLGLSASDHPSAAEIRAEGGPQEGKGKVEEGAKLEEELPQEPPATVEGTCAVAFRFPEGRRITRRFFLSDSVQVLKLFCQSQVSAGASARTFQVSPTLPGSAPLDLASRATIGDLGLANSLLAVTWA